LTIILVEEMGKKGREIVEVDIEELLELLKKAYADEWIAYYSYKWVPREFEKLHDLANCKKVNFPEDIRDLKGFLEALAEAEGCAIEVYNKIVKKLGPCYNKDIRTFHLIEHILSEEIQHEEEFENLL